MRIYPTIHALFWRQPNCHVPVDYPSVSRRLLKFLCKALTPDHHHRQVSSCLSLSQDKVQVKVSTAARVIIRFREPAATMAVMAVPQSRSPGGSLIVHSLSR